MKSVPLCSVLVVLTAITVIAGCTTPAPPPPGTVPPASATPVPAGSVTPIPPGPVITAASPHASPSLTATWSPASPQKFMVFFPWPEGEREILTSDYHQHGAFDFVNFTSPEAAVSAVAEGTVLLSDHSHPDDFNVYPACNKSSFLDLGNFVLLQHGPHTFLLYAHLSHDDPAPVKPGQEVKAGTRIGRQGNTGCSDGAHLHFAVVDIQLFPEPAFIPVPKSSWGFYEVNGSNSLVLNTQYISGNMPAGTGDGQEKK